MGIPGRAPGQQCPVGLELGDGTGADKMWEQQSLALREEGERRQFCLALWWSCGALQLPEDQQSPEGFAARLCGRAKTAAVCSAEEAEQNEPSWSQSGCVS